MTALPNVELDPPTISMTFGVNDSPLAGRDGTYVSAVFSVVLYLLLCILLDSFMFHVVFVFTRYRYVN